jgi:asparagine synthase (glutamine-hydrolysing)
LDRIKGMFALIVWDGRRDTLLGARDRTGVYPLFYAEAGSEFLLSTSTEPLIRHPRVSRTLDRAALASHLAHDWLRSGETYFEAVRKLPAGHALRLEGGESRVWRYWDPVPPGRPVNWITEDRVGEFDALLGQAVGRCLDVGTAGIFLSGGLDSVSVAAVAADESRRHGMPAPLALSIDFPDPEGDEKPIQTAVARQLGLSQVLLPFEDLVGPEGVLQSALDLSSVWPWPVMHPATVPYYSLSLEGRRRGCRVIMTGQGGDEWLAVTPAYTADFLRVLDVVNVGRLIGVTLRSYRTSPLGTVRILLWQYGLRALLSAAAAGALERLVPGGLRLRRTRAILGLVPDWVAPDPAVRRAVEERIGRGVDAELRAPQPRGFGLRHMRSLLDTHLEDEFERSRRAGLRLLHPFCDADLVDFVCRTPPAISCLGGRTKGLVRRTLARRFPGLGFERQKKLLLRNFYQELVLKEAPAVWQKMGGAQALAELGVVDGAVLQPAMATLLSGDRPEEFYRVWDVLNLEAWLRPRV